jgi:hypothetical protein
VLPPGSCSQHYEERDLLTPQYVCETSCTRLFFSGGSASEFDRDDVLSFLRRPSLEVFVLVPLLWLPFAVYANNEAAQLIDGVWFHFKNAALDGNVRIGLSTTSQGYYTIAPLIHAMTIACAGIVAMMLWTGGGYAVQPPDGLDATPVGRAAKKALDTACFWVTVGAVILNSVMLLRTLLEIGSSLWEEEDAQRGTHNFTSRLLDSLSRAASAPGDLRSADPQHAALGRPKRLSTGDRDGADNRDGMGTPSLLVGSE